MKGIVLDAYREGDDPDWTLKDEGGSLQQKTRAMSYNITQRQYQHQYEEYLAFYLIGEQWYQEAAYLEDPDDQLQALKGLALILPRRDTQVALRLYQWFQYRPQALMHFSTCRTKVEKMTDKESKEVERVVRDYYMQLLALDNVLDIEC
jgi:hypothetical protein